MQVVATVPLKLRPYGTIQICLLVLLLLFHRQVRKSQGTENMISGTSADRKFAVQ